MAHFLRQTLELPLTLSIMAGSGLSTGRTTLPVLLSANICLSVVGEIPFFALLLCPVNFRYTLMGVLSHSSRNFPKGGPKGHTISRVVNLS